MTDSFDKQRVEPFEKEIGSPATKEEAWEDIFEAGETGTLPFATTDTYLDAYRVQSEDENKKILAFKLGVEEYALDILEVKEILRFQPPTFVPRTKPFVLGVISIRGEVLPILDLKHRMGLGQTKITEKTRILIVERRDERFGLTVDAITSVEDLSRTDIESSPHVRSTQEEGFVEGIGRRGERILILVRVTEVLNFGSAAELEKT